jgi:putative ATP-dependent endonuclease of OLD family
MPPADEVKALVRPILQKDKGSGYAGRLIELCDVAELPPTVVAFLNIVYGAFKRPEPVPPIEPEETEALDAAISQTDGSAQTPSVKSP